MCQHIENENYCHERANHEDNLFVSRTNIFIGVNGFFVIGIGLIKGDVNLQIILTFMIIIINIIWLLWAPRSRKFIRALRDSGSKRKDEEIWREGPGKVESPVKSKLRWLKDPLTLICTFVPSVLLLGWIAILIYFLCRSNELGT